MTRRGKRTSTKVKIGKGEVNLTSKGVSISWNRSLNRSRKNLEKGLEKAKKNFERSLNRTRRDLEYRWLKFTRDLDRAMKR
jgi:hypothetical protein